MRCPVRAPLTVALLALLAATTLTPSAGAADDRLYATDIALGEQKGEAEIIVAMTSKPVYSARLEREGTRLIVDVADCRLRGVKGAVTRHVGVVGGVMAQEFKVGRRYTTRILVTLLEEAKYRIRAEGDRLVLTFKAGKSGELDLPGPKSVPRGASSDGRSRIQDIRFNHEGQRDQIVIDVTPSPEYRVVRAGPGKTQLILRAADLPPALVRALDVAAFGGPVATVASYLSELSSERVVLEVEHSATSKGRVERVGSSLVWSFAEPGAESWSATGVASDGGPARKAQTLHVEDDYSDIPVVQTSIREEALNPEPAVREQAVPVADHGAFSPALYGQQQARRYTGRRIDLDLKDADIHNVLRLLADVGRVNIVTADDVSGSVTIRMRNVPWDQALDIVLQSKKLGMVQQGNMIRVAPQAQLDHEREMEIKRRAEQAKLEPLETRLVPVSYAQAGDLQPRARELLSERGSIAVDDRTNVMIVRDVPGNLNQVEELVRSLDTQTPQVLVEARIVEATSRYLRDVGIQWGGDTTFSPATGNDTGLAFPNSVGLAGGASDGATPTAGLSPFSNSIPNPNFAVNLPAAVGTGQGGAIGLTFGSVDNTVNLNVRLTAAESSGMLRILSSPRILTLDNTEARISQGTLIPFSQVSAQGVQTTFQEAKLQLLVRPHVTADGSVSMNVKINRDEPDFNQTSARGDPTILKREAETTLLVADGHTAVIGGIFTRNTGRNLDQVPFFGDIPVIGLLFQRRRASDSRGELVIFLTPRIVNRAEALGR